MSTRKDLPATWRANSITGMVMGVSKSGWCQTSARLRSLKARRVSDVCGGEAGPLWCGIEDEST